MVAGIWRYRCTKNKNKYQFMYLSVSIHLVHIYMIKGVKIERVLCLAKL